MSEKQCPVIGPDVDVIYLAPRCSEGPHKGRCWCDEPQEPCPECGATWVKFIRAKGNAT